MPRSRAVFLALLLAALAARAEEPPYLDFVRGLRAGGMPDLAAEYLQKLSAHPPPGLAPLLPLELAKTRIDAAQQEGDERKRAALLVQARTACEAYLRQNPRGPRAADATLDLARLVALQGKQQLTQARRFDGSPEARKSLAARALPLFEEASVKLNTAETLINEQLQAPDLKPTEKKTLEAAALQVQLELGLNRLDQGLAIGDDNKRRGDLILQAKGVLERLSVLDADGPTGWLARAWVGYCLQETDNLPAAMKEYEAVSTEKSPAAEAASRLATLWLLQLKYADPRVPTTLRPALVAAVQKGCEDWLARHRTAAATSEGQSIRFLLGVTLADQGAALTTPAVGNKPATVGASARLHFNRAATIFKELADGDNEYADRARQRRAGILVLLIAERANEPVELLPTFEDCYLLAQVAAHELGHAQSTDEGGRLLRRVIRALERGLKLAGRGDPARDLFDARAMLAYAYLSADHPYAAAVLGEYLARTAPTAARGAEAAAYALQGYAHILQADRERNAPEDEVQADQRRLRAAAEAMEKTWPDETATDLARHQLGSLAIEDGSYAEACGLLARVAPTYPGLARARWQEGVAAQLAQNAKQLPAAEKARLLRQAVADLGKVPAPTPGPDAVASCSARLQLGTLLLLEPPEAARYARIEVIGRGLSEQLPRLFAADAHNPALPQLKSEAAKLQLAGTVGRAALLLRDDQFAAAHRLLDPLVAQVQQDFAQPSPAGEAAKPYAQRYQAAQREALVLALRAAIQEGKPEEAKRVLAALQKAAAGNALVSVEAMLLKVVQDMKAELDLLRAKGQKDRQARLEKGLLAFLGELAKPKDLSPTVRLFLAQGYSSLEQHAQAAELLAPLPEPKPEDAAMRDYRVARLLLAREYRLGGQYAEAQAVLAPILAKGGWGANDPGVRREAVLLMEDAKRYPVAIRLCEDVLKGLRPQLAASAEGGGNAALKERYYQFLYLQTRCGVKEAQAGPQKGGRLRRLAYQIVELEKSTPDFGGEGMKERYRELMESEPPLKALYAEQGGQALLADGKKMS